MTESEPTTDARRVARYFDARANDYAENFSRGLLGRVREREWRVVRQLLGPEPGETILDAGSGPGSYSVRLAALGCRPRAVDLSPRMVEQAQARGVEASVGALETLALGCEFDAVLCAGALEFSSEPERVLERLVRHVRPGGRLVLLYPTRTVLGLAYRTYHARRGIRVRVFAPRELERELGALGLERLRSRRATPLSAVIRGDRP
ncbi:MAG: methyltransferase domain-containing protein [Polyangiaceae bacterium]